MEGGLNIFNPLWPPHIHLFPFCSPNRIILLFWYYWYSIFVLRCLSKYPNVKHRICYDYIALIDFLLSSRKIVIASFISFPNFMYLTSINYQKLISMKHLLSLFSINKCSSCLSFFLSSLLSFLPYFCIFLLKICLLMSSCVILHSFPPEHFHCTPFWKLISHFWTGSPVSNDRIPYIPRSSFSYLDWTRHPVASSEPSHWS